METPPARSTGLIELLARRHPVSSHLFSRGPAADGRTNTIISTGKEPERGHHGIAGVLVLLNYSRGQWVEKQLESHAPGALPRQGGNSAHLAGQRPRRLSPGHRRARPGVVCPHLSVAKATGPLNAYHVLALGPTPASGCVLSFLFYYQTAYEQGASFSSQVLPS